jgi:hypothetical protein
MRVVLRRIYSGWWRGGVGHHADEFLAQALGGLSPVDTGNDGKVRAFDENCPREGGPGTLAVVREVHRNFSIMWGHDGSTD